MNAVQLVRWSLAHARWVRVLSVDGSDVTVCLSADETRTPLDQTCDKSDLLPSKPLEV